jgi:hypothetical protein
MQRNEPCGRVLGISVASVGVGVVVVVEAGYTETGIHPPGACVIFAFSCPTNRGIEGPVRSTSRIPTEWP